jgi:hypothetical protein
MPVHGGKDARGYYMQWGDRGKKYYYQKDDAKSKMAAKRRAHQQERAAYANGYDRK